MILLFDNHDKNKNLVTVADSHVLRTIGLREASQSCPIPLLIDTDLGRHRMGKHLLMLSVLCLLTFSSLHGGSLVVAGSSEKPDKLGRSHGNSGRTGIMKQTIKISGGRSSGHGATGGRSPSAAGGQRGGAMIPIYTAGSARNHQSHSGGAGNSRWCSSSPIILATAILICFFMLM
ncbi:hypothetical protein SAY87_006931 [Trapa incisa]|uniref:Uncharacterized protein n=1 Tax=Trapa incisa TaxID=236973 RepID=A0AAN7K058_9MYRT|nr:hypothetical protein SAY87_006931 [Trapa incisa]